jgi:hypothetical protein
MSAAVVRLALAAVTALSLATVPVYPGATLDAAGMKEERARDPKRTNTAYLTTDSFEKVSAFYKNQKGAKQDQMIGIGNGKGGTKLGLFYIDGNSVALNWPVNFRDKSGKYVAGTRISIDKE